MQKLIIGLKREFWEHRKIVLGIPLLLSIIIVLGAIGITIWGHDQPPATQEMKNGIPFRFIQIYLGIAWLVGLYYLAQSLHADRRDKSILFWKSVPASETLNVLTKFLFGSVVIAAISLAIAWLVYLCLTLLGLGAGVWLEDTEKLRYVERTIIVTRLFIWPVFCLFVATIWAAPVFSLFLLVSAFAKKSPFFLLVIPLVVVSLIEQGVFGSAYINGFLNAHLPFAVIDTLADSESLVVAARSYFVEHGVGMVAGLLLSSLMIYCTVWCRNHRFEI
jgi:ABC-2 type transport system permease protein